MKKRSTFYIEKKARAFLLWLKRTQEPGKSMSDYLNEFIFEKMKEFQGWEKKNK